MNHNHTRPGILLFAVAVILGSFATLRGELDGSALTPFVVVAFIAIIVGMQLPVSLAQRVLTPLTTAAALGLILAPLNFDGRAPGAASVLVIVWLGMLIGGVARRLRGRQLVEGSLAARFLGMALTAVLARDVSIGDTTVVEWAFADGTRRSLAVFALLAVAAVGGLFEGVLEKAVLWLDEGGTLLGMMTDEIRPLAGIAAATASAGPLIAVAHPVLDWVAIPLLLLPVLMMYLAVQWVQDSRRDLEESIAAMSRLPEVSGFSRTGHGRRVADIAVRIANEMSVDPETSQRIERTALLHDLGHLGLPEPLPGGRTLNASSQTQEQIACTTVRIVGSAPMFEELLPLLDQVRTPFRQWREFGERIPLESRIVRVANAWDDITEGARSPRARQVALERLHLGLGYEYDPDVVAALEQVFVAEGALVV
ncbi:HD domain-containing protein [Janibacter cremeus]|uniref:HD domain-containing phosphohydrolase n=1 Tax=Janibacter cremeus TaxID=1285192 RepID=UPI0023F90BE4|nr:HD domain-containing phosphohydrolase [Janibacter cremeus]WEV78203.1 HD domain-containing protein [Janibacter cremeus]WEV78283.1 HD domain-containing protein [Janibacter cremeus]